MQQLQGTMANKNAWNWCLETTPEANLNTTILDNKVMNSQEHYGSKWSLSWWLWSIHQLEEYLDPLPCGCKMQHQTATKPSQNNEQKQQTNYAKSIG